MSLLMVAHAPEGVMVMTDTLSTVPDGTPFMFVSKTSIEPQLELLVAFTGIANAGARWTTYLRERIVCRDIDNLDWHVPTALRGIWRDVRNEHDIGDGTATVYHFGWSAQAEQYVGFAYRSADDFASAALAPGYRIKPEPADGLDTVPSSLDEWIGLAERIKADQEKRPADERIHIGGELVLTTMQNRTITSSKVHRFASYEDDWQAMCDRLDNDIATPPT